MRVNKIVFTVLFLSILFISSACSSKPPLELESATVDLGNDEGRLGGVGITSGDRKGDVIVPVALSYDIVLKNVSKKAIGGDKEPNNRTFEYDDGIKVHFEPTGVNFIMTKTRLSNLHIVRNAST